MFQTMHLDFQIGAHLGRQCNPILSNAYWWIISTHTPHKPQEEPSGPPSHTPRSARSLDSLIGLCTGERTDQVSSAADDGLFEGLWEIMPARRNGDDSRNGAFMSKFSRSTTASEVDFHLAQNYYAI